MTDPLRRPAILLLVILALLALGWAYGVLTDWQAIADRPVRLAYLIADFGLVIPLGVIGAVGVLRRRAWSAPLFAVALGALLFDIAHGVFYLIWDNFFGIPWAVAFGLLLLTLAYVALGVRALIRSAAMRGGPVATGTQAGVAAGLRGEVSP